MPLSADAPEGKRTACYDIEVEVVSGWEKCDVNPCVYVLCSQDDPLKSSMHSFLMSHTNQQEIANLDAKVGLFLCAFHFYKSLS